MYRLGAEAIFGLRRQGVTPRVTPSIPPEWPSYELIYRSGGTTYAIRVENPRHVSGGPGRITLDGQVLPDDAIPLCGMTAPGTMWSWCWDSVNS